MKRTLATLVLVVALTVVPAASAKPPTHKQVVRLQHRLHNMTLARNAVKAKLAAEQAQNAALQGQVTQLTGELWSLQAQIAAIPTPLSIAVAQVQHEVTWAEGGAPAYSHGTLLSLAALEYAVGHVSVGEYGYLEVKGLPLPAHTPNAILGAQAGICGETSLAFASIMQHLGYQTRRITFYWTLADGTPDGHTAVEVLYDGGWHYFDPTFGQYWTDESGNVQSITDARLGGGTRHKDDLSFTNLIEDPWFAGDDTSFETDPGTTVVLGGDPFVG